VRIRRRRLLVAQNGTQFFESKNCKIATSIIKIKRNALKKSRHRGIQRTQRQLAA
jgi:hypothetical protein